MGANTQSLDISIIEVSGLGELLGIKGFLNFTQAEEGHSHELEYEISVP